MNKNFEHCEERLPKREKMGRAEENEGLDMSLVKQLEEYQKKVNSGMSKECKKCNLNPKKDLSPCKECDFYKKCKSAVLERKYIHGKKENSRTATRRRNVDSKNKLEESVRKLHEDFEEDID